MTSFKSASRPARKKLAGVAVFEGYSGVTVKGKREAINK